jgi:hypothetical protein
LFLRRLMRSSKDEFLSGRRLLRSSKDDLFRPSADDSVSGTYCCGTRTGAGMAARQGVFEHYFIYSLIPANSPSSLI